MGDKDNSTFIEQGSSNDPDTGNYASVLSGYDPSWWEPQDLGESWKKY